MKSAAPGLIVLFGSGETQASSGKTHEFTAQQLAEPPRIAILETPAGFEPNSALVAEKAAEALARRLQNYKPKVNVIPARKKGTPFSPDNADIVDPILEANWTLLGPGSPSYGVRQLQASRALANIIARHRLGGVLMVSSSATLAFSSFTLPVYEIYKVGEELHWKEGLDFFGHYGVPLVVIPHWNNNDGGDELDTSRCYMGQERFEQLRKLLPPGHVILGIDEHTSVTLDVHGGEGRVWGSGGIVILRAGRTTTFESGDAFDVSALGEWYIPEAGAGIPEEIWQLAVDAVKASQAPVEPTDDVLSLLEQRLKAREQRDWTRADELRDAIAELGWSVMDTPEGPQLQLLEN